MSFLHLICEYQREHTFLSLHDRGTTAKSRFTQPQVKIVSSVFPRATLPGLVSIIYTMSLFEARAEPSTRSADATAVLEYCFTSTHLCDTGNGMCRCTPR